MNRFMTWNAQRNTKPQVEQTGLGTFACFEFLPKLFEGLRSMVCMQLNGFAVAASCVAFLTGVIIPLEYSVPPFDIRFGFTQNFLLGSFTVSPVSSVPSSSTARQFGHDNFGRNGLGIMPRNEIGDTGVVHMGLNRNRLVASAVAEISSLFNFDPLIDSMVVGFGVISGVGLITDMPCHKFNGIQFNEGLQANRVNCWKPHRVMARAISSQAGSTLPEGSETTGAV
jgi:hypothetical protein